MKKDFKASSGLNCNRSALTLLLYGEVSSGSGHGRVKSERTGFMTWAASPITTTLPFTYLVIGSRIRSGYEKIPSSGAFLSGNQLKELTGRHSRRTARLPLCSDGSLAPCLKDRTERLGRFDLPCVSFIETIPSTDSPLPDLAPLLGGRLAKTLIARARPPSHR